MKKNEKKIFEKSQPFWDVTAILSELLFVKIKKKIGS